SQSKLPLNDYYLLVSWTNNEIRHIIIVVIRQCIEIRKCYNVTIVFGSIEITLKITDCKNVSISVVCRRLVINQCRSSSFYILIPTGPLVKFNLLKFIICSL
ncbi:unnamed protein product, partial [Didymodactylos carnosus]